MGWTTGICLAGAVPLAVLGLAGCGILPTHDHVRHRPSPAATATPRPKPTELTAIAPDGVNLRSAPDVAGSLIGVVAQGVSLPIVSHTAANGGWWQVRAQSGLGWMTADSDDTSTASFETYQASGTHPWTVLYPSGWSFAQAPSGMVQFSGAGQTITVDTAGSIAALPAPPSPIPGTESITPIEVYGISTALVAYRGGGLYQGGAELLGQPGEAFLIESSGPLKNGPEALSLFLDTFSFPIPTP